jgi:hypothetical protein
MASIAAEYGWEGMSEPVTAATIAPARLAALAGSYKANADRIWRFAVEGDHLVFTTPFHEAQRLVPISETEFVSREDPSRYTLTGDTVVMSPPPSGVLPKIARVATDATVPLDDVAAGRVDQAVARYKEAIAKSPTEETFSEDRINGLGVEQLLNGNAPAALLLFRVNVALHPDSMNVHDSLAEGYLRAGDRTKAAAAFRASLAAAGRDAKAPASIKESLRKNAVDRLKKLGEAP